MYHKICCSILLNGWKRSILHWVKINKVLNIITFIILKLYSDTVVYKYRQIYVTSAAFESFKTLRVVECNACDNVYIKYTMNQKICCSIFLNGSVIFKVCSVTVVYYYIQTDIDCCKCCVWHFQNFGGCQMQCLQQSSMHLILIES